MRSARTDTESGVSSVLLSVAALDDLLAEVLVETLVDPPARLLIDTLQSDPAVVAKGTRTLTVGFHVTSTCGGPVQGALV
jgi:hypothetical protein